MDAEYRPVSAPRVLLFSPSVKLSVLMLSTPVIHALSSAASESVYRLLVSKYSSLYTVEPCYNAVVGAHDFGRHCTRGRLSVPISAIRELINNSDRHPLHQVQEPCRSHSVLAALSYTPIYSLWNLLNEYTSINVYYFKMSHPVES